MILTVQNRFQSLYVARCAYSELVLDDAAAADDDDYDHGDQLGGAMRIEETDHQQTTRARD